MATINGVAFDMVNLRPVAVHRNSISEQPGSDTNFITDMGYDGLVLRLEGFEETLATYDSVISEFMKSGEQTLVHRTGWQFKVYSAQLTPELIAGFADNYFPYDLILYTSTPYRESTSETTRSKTITTNNQEWSADDSANDIDTDGSVDAVPDIQITGGAVATTANRESGYEDTNTDATVYTNSNTTWTLEKTHTFTADSHYGWILNTVGMDLQSGSSSYTGYGKVSYQAPSLNGGAETDVPGASWSKLNPGYQSFSITDLDVQCAANENLTVRFYLKSSSGVATANFQNLDYDILASRKDVCKNPQVYNTADTTVKSEVANEIDPDMEIKINVDGTGTLTYADDFSTSKYLDAQWETSGTTYDDPNNELDFGNSEYLTYKIDTKHPITSIPTLTATIDIDTGTPTIKISSDDVTYYDIDSAIVDNVSTVYDLDNASNLSLKGLTTFYFKINCDGSSTCSLTIFSLSINLVTIDVEHPKISATGVSTYRCDQHADSGLACEISLIYRDRSWPA